MKATSRALAFLLFAGLVSACTGNNDANTGTAGTESTAPTTMSDTGAPASSTTSDTTTTSDSTSNSTTSSTGTSMETSGSMTGDSVSGGTTGTTTGTTATGANTTTGTTDTTAAPATTEPGSTDTPAAARSNERSVHVDKKGTDKKKKTGKGTSGSTNETQKSGSTSGAGMGTSTTTSSESGGSASNMSSSSSGVSNTDDQGTGTFSAGAGSGTDATGSRIGEGSASGQIGVTDTTRDGSTVGNDNAYAPITSGTTSSTTTSTTTTTDQSSQAASGTSSKNDQSNPAKFYEPQSKAPDKTGSLGVTGVDRSHAQTGKKVGIMTDPTVEAKKDQEFTRGESIRSVKLDKYPYTKRGDFKNDMESRLDSMESRITELKSNQGEDKVAANNYQDMISTLETKYKAAESKLKTADQVPQGRWEGYKIEFRDQIAEIERSYEALRTAMQ